jgi:hypothetical protein
MRASLPVALLFALTACDTAPPPEKTGETGGSTEDLDGDGYSAAAGDCDDLDAAVYPGAAETWYDGVDGNCDGLDDYDADGDGVQGGDAGADCDDDDAAVYPGADELCDDADNDCDEEVDEDAIDAVDAYTDNDGDGYGIGNSLGLYCDAPPGAALQDGDCDDADAAINPGAVEVCDDADNDCDDFVDDDPTDGATYYADLDGDGYGDPAAASVACEQPEQYVEDATDCDDTDPLTYPGATEFCDLEDNDCDGTADEEATDPRTYYLDSDADGYGDATQTTTACGAPSGYAELDTDCDDADAAINPGAYEACDGIDNDCDGETDTDSPDAATWYPDADGDGYGDAASGAASCEQPEGTLADGSDCDDGDAAVNPSATEMCDDVDNNCDGATDEATAADAPTWYVDADGDGYGVSSGFTSACDQPAGYADNATDCDDAEPAANPGNRESCDGIDNDCDGTTDEDDATDASAWYIDADGDSYGDAAATTTSCSAPSGYVGNDNDCDDTDDTINPLASELDDDVDNDCDELVDEDFVSVGDIVVTEITRQPYVGGSGSSTNANAQWFEVYNTSGSDVNMSGWYVEEQDGDSFFVSGDAGVVVVAGGYAVFCYEADYFADTTKCDYEWGDSSWGSPYYDTTFYFDRDEDLISFYMDGVLMDEVHWTYDETEGYWPRTAKYSASLDDDSFDMTANDDEENWCVYSGTDTWSSSSYSGGPDYGTPRAANPSCD